MNFNKLSKEKLKNLFKKWFNVTWIEYAVALKHQVLNIICQIPFDNPLHKKAQCNISYCKSKASLFQHVYSESKKESPQ